MNNKTIKKRNKYFKYLPFYFLIILIISCASPPKGFNSLELLDAPDYSHEKNWSALPFRKDVADKIPKNETWIHDSLKQVDVFYVHPTLYSHGKTWNAKLNNKSLNRRIDKFPVKIQSTPFNHVGRVYAPRYRQAILESYFDTTGVGKQALSFAYEDVKNAFEYFLKHYNKGRPIIIASHSQGSNHCRKLLKEYFDNEAMKQQLVAAYIVGFAVFPEDYELLEPCEQATDNHCYITWASYQKDYYPSKKNKLSQHLLGNVCINPVSWTRDTLMTTGKGAFLLNINKKKYKVKCQIKDNYLWVDTNMTFFKRKKTLHTIDYNLFWYDIRENAKIRVDNYILKNEN